LGSSGLVFFSSQSTWDSGRVIDKTRDNGATGDRLVLTKSLSGHLLFPFPPLLPKSARRSLVLYHLYDDLWSVLLSVRLFCRVLRGMLLGIDALQYARAVYTIVTSSAVLPRDLRSSIRSPLAFSRRIEEVKAAVIPESLQSARSQEIPWYFRRPFHPP
jgi:hypothetical protein